MINLKMMQYLILITFLLMSAQATQTIAYVNKAVLITGDIVVPASPLDNVFKPKAVDTTSLNIKFYEFFNGDELTEDNKVNFYKQVAFGRNKGFYETTDHLPLSVTVGGVNFLYVSLDNSVRANENGFPLFVRLDGICGLVRNIIRSFGVTPDGYPAPTVVFFSESSRPSFSGSMADKKDVHSWLQVRYQLENQCGLKYLTEKRNNDDVNGMSFGVSAFCTTKALQEIESYHTVSLLTEGFGSGSTGIKLKTGEIVWGIHFPLDFKGDGLANLNYKTMLGLQKVMTDFKGSVCALGDFNTIPGKLSDVINLAINENYEFAVHDTLTFFGSHYDTIKTTEQWVSILD